MPTGVSGSLVKLVYECSLDDLGTLNRRGGRWGRRRHCHGAVMRIMRVRPGIVVGSHGFGSAIGVSIGAFGCGWGSRGVGRSGYFHGVALWRARHLDSRGEDGHGARSHWIILAVAVVQGRPVGASLHYLSHLQSQRGKTVSVDPTSGRRERETTTGSAIWQVGQTWEDPGHTRRLEGPDCTGEVEARSSIEHLLHSRRVSWGQGGWVGITHRIAPHGLGFGQLFVGRIRERRGRRSLFARGMLFCRLPWAQELDPRTRTAGHSRSPQCQ